MIKASCHCGGVKVEVPHVPERLTSCNCSICRRLGALMAYYRPDQVVITGTTVAYVQGDKTLALHHCPTCGCTTHWLGLDPNQQERMGVNARMMDPKVIAGVRIRRLDGADTWEYLD